LSADLGFTTDCSSSFRQQPSELAERNSTKTGYMLVSECDLIMHVRNLGYPNPTNRGPQTHLFSTTSQLNGKAYIAFINCYSL